MLLLLLLFALLPTSAPAQTRALSIDAGSGVHMVAVDRGRGDAVFSLAELARLGMPPTIDARGASIVVARDTIRFEFGSPLLRVGRQSYQLAAATRRNGAAALVSTQFLTDWLPTRYSTAFTFTSNTLRRKSTAAPVANAPVSTQAAPASPQQKPAADHRVVVIDAGHGGKDPGKVGPNGLSEKTVTLTVATRLAALLKDKGYEVHMTRATDTLIGLADRPKLANEWKNGRPATLFVSIHANAGVSRAEGFETYFLSEARTEDERRVAAMENAAVSFEEKSSAAPAIDQLLTGLRNDYYQRASNDFAEVIQRELAAFHPGPSRGVKQAGFRVLVGAVMPAVLVEIAFISNPGEARLLGTAAFQDKIAYGLARSIANFFDSHEHLWIASEGAQ